LGLASFILTVLVMSPTPPDVKTDGIVVLTGGADRVRTGLDLLAAGQAPQLLVSGVHKNAALNDLATKARVNAATLPCCITLGFKALDTVGNAQETAEWARQHNIARLRVVTATYHMPRAILEMKRAMPHVWLVIHPVRPESFSPLRPSGLRLLLTEYHKTIVTTARLVVDILRRWGLGS
jgi:uncharacterized SAM-binding protein YcdF (DUF218 family)